MSPVARPERDDRASIHRAPGVPAGRRSDRPVRVGQHDAFRSAHELSSASSMRNRRIVSKPPRLHQDLPGATVGERPGCRRSLGRNAGQPVHAACQVGAGQYPPREEALALFRCAAHPGSCLKVFDVTTTRRGRQLADPVGEITDLLAHVLAQSLHRSPVGTVDAPRYVRLSIPPSGSEMTISGMASRPVPNSIEPPPISMLSRRPAYLASQCRTADESTAFLLAGQQLQAQPRLVFDGVRI